MLMGIDIGTTTSKVAIYSLSGKLKGHDDTEYQVSHPHPTWAEQDPKTWIEALKKSIPNALKKAKIQPSSLTGICISAQAPTLVPVNANGDPLVPAMIWLDNRATQECNNIGEKIGEDQIYSLSGLRLAASFIFPKILWLKSNRESVFSNVRWFHQAKDFIVNKLTEERVTDVTHATGYFCFDVRKQKEDYSIFEQYNIDPNLVPKILPCTTIVAETTSSAAQFGLASGIPVINGSIDAIMAVLGMGVFYPNIVCEVAGTSTVQVNSTENILMDPTRRYTVNISPLGNFWSSASMMNTTGAVLKWFRDKIWKPTLQTKLGPDEPYDLFSEWASRSPVGARGLIMLPYLQGERSPWWDPQARGLFFGLTMQHNLYDIVRAILESSALANLHNMEELAKLGMKPSEVRISGGPSRSDIWNQIKADAYGLPLLRPDARFPENLGDAILAGLATKQLTLSGAESWITINKTYRPDNNNHKLYKKLLDIYIDLYSKSKDLMGKIGEVGLPS